MTKMNEVMKRLNCNEEKATEFMKDAERWIKAIEEKRMICIIKSVSGSGMSRIFRYLSCEKGKTGGFYYSGYYTFFEALGLKPKNYGEIRVHGCGMDMNFSTCYDIAHSLKKMKIITKERCEKLAQITPTCV